MPTEPAFRLGSASHRQGRTQTRCRQVHKSPDLGRRIAPRAVDDVHRNRRFLLVNVLTLNLALDEAKVK